jgi:U3 small nucleolar RNA-associated protein 11
MLSDKSGKQGKHGARESTSLSHDTVKLLKTQDAGYLRTVGERVRREMERLEKEVRLQDGMEKILREKGSSSRNDDDDEDEDDIFGSAGGGGNKKRKLVFAGSREDQKKLGRQIDGEEDDEDEEVEEDEDEESESLGKQLQSSKKQQIEAQRQAHSQRRAAKLKRRAAESRHKKLEALRKQYTDIAAAERELDLQRARMSHSIGGVNKNGVKWKVKERKR